MIDTATPTLEGRLQSLAGYLDFLNQIDSDASRLHTGRGRSMRVRRLDPEIRKTLRASYFILAYNAVEAAARDVLGDLYRQMTADQRRFSEIKDSWQFSIVKQQMQELFSQASGPDAHYRRIQSMLNGASLGHVVRVDLVKLPISGNVDNEYIREEVCARYGIRYLVPRTCRDGTDLKLIRQHRNALAHGEMSFPDVGKDYLVGQLRSINRRVKLYLLAFTRSSKKYQAANEFLRAGT